MVELLAWLELPRQQPLSRAIAAWFDRVLRQSRGRSGLVGAIPEFEDLGEVKNMLQETMTEWWDEARRKGHEKGLDEGRAEGELSGLEKGKAEGIYQVALTMKRKGMLAAQISELTGLSSEDIDNLS